MSLFHISTLIAFAMTLLNDLRSYTRPYIIYMIAILTNIVCCKHETAVQYINIETESAEKTFKIQTIFKMESTICH